MTNESPALLERVRQALTSQPQKTVTVLSSLLAVEDDLGYLPPEAIEEVALHTDVSTNNVWAVASFYTNFRFEPPGRHVVEVCWGPTCHLKGAQELLDAVQGALGISHEGDTPDGRATLRYNTCLGACAQAPVLMADHRMMGRMTLEHARELILQWNQNG